MASEFDSELDAAIGQLSYVSANTELLTEKRAQRVLSLLGRTNPNVVKTLLRQIDAVENEIRKDVAIGQSGEIVLTPIQLRAAIARAAIRGCTQTSLDEAMSLADANDLEDLYELELANNTNVQTGLRISQPTLFDAEAA